MPGVLPLEPIRKIEISRTRRVRVRVRSQSQRARAYRARGWKVNLIFAGKVGCKVNLTFDSKVRGKVNLMVNLNGRIPTKRTTFCAPLPDLFVPHHAAAEDHSLFVPAEDFKGFQFGNQLLGYSQRDAGKLRKVLVVMWPQGVRQEAVRVSLIHQAEH